MEGDIFSKMILYKSTKGMSICILLHLQCAKNKITNFKLIFADWQKKDRIKLPRLAFWKWNLPGLVVIFNQVRVCLGGLKN